MTFQSCSTLRGEEWPREQLYVLCWRQEWWTLLKRLEVVCNINEVFIHDVQYRLLCE